jgi:hypothetical protein
MCSVVYIVYIYYSGAIRQMDLTEWNMEWLEYALICSSVAKGGEGNCVYIIYFRYTL